MASATSRAPPLPLKPARFHIAQLEKLLTGEIQPTPTPKFNEDEIRQMIAQIEKPIIIFSSLHQYFSLSL